MAFFPPFLWHAFSVFCVVHIITYPAELSPGILSNHLKLTLLKTGKLFSPLILSTLQGCSGAQVPCCSPPYKAWENHCAFRTNSLSSTGRQPGQVVFSSTKCIELFNQLLLLPASGPGLCCFNSGLLSSNAFLSYPGWKPVPDKHISGAAYEVVYKYKIRITTTARVPVHYLWNTHTVNIWD